MGTENEGDAATLGEITRDPGRVSEGHGEWSEIR